MGSGKVPLSACKPLLLSVIGGQRSIVLSILVMHAAQDSWKVTPYETREHVPGVDSLYFHRGAVRHNAELKLV